MTVVLDASALLAMLLGEPGDKIVQAAIPDSTMCAVNLSEVVGHLARYGGTEADIRAILGPLPIGVVPFDDGLAYPMFSTHQNKPHIISILCRLCGSCGTTTAS